MMEKKWKTQGWQRDLSWFESQRMQQKEKQQKREEKEGGETQVCGVYSHCVESSTKFREVNTSRIKEGIRGIAKQMNPNQYLVLNACTSHVEII